MTFGHDLRYALRTFRQQPLFAATAVLTLALGIGATTAIFTVVNAVLLRPLGYHEPDQLVRISGGVTMAKLEAIRPAKSFSNVGAFTIFTENVPLAGVDGAQPLQGARVTTNFLTVLGVRPLLGRGFLAEEEQNDAPVALISHRLWQERFGGDRAIEGRAARLGGQPSTIIGVLPAGFVFPNAGLDVWRPWQPNSMPLRVRQNSPLLSVFGRLTPGTSLAEANAEMTLIHGRYAETHGAALDARGRAPAPVTALKDGLVSNVRSLLWMLSGAVACLLMIACANVAGLLLARTAARSREFAVRAALGAGRGQIIRQQFTESLLLALPGGILGVLLGGWMLRGIGLVPGLELPRLEEVQLDNTVLAFSIALALATGVLFSLAPALSASRLDLAIAMKSNGEFARPVVRRAMWRSPGELLVVAQVALAIVLLSGAALLLQSLARLRQVDPGFRSDHLLTMQITMPPARFNELVERVEALPGVRSAAVTLTLPTTGYASTPVHVVGQPLAPLNERPLAVLQAVTPGYFATLGIPLKRGRDFRKQDTGQSHFVAVINEATARRFWPAYPQGMDPVGRSILAGANPEPLEIVGIAADVQQGGLGEPAEAGIYRPRTQTSPMPAMFAIRATGEPRQLVNTIRREVTAIDADQAISNVRTMEEAMEASESRRQTVLLLLGLFASTGLALAVVGIYGVVAYSAAQRTREMGIRRALGASQRSIAGLVLRHGLALACAGVALGLAAALALTRLLQSLLFGVTATDPGTLAAVSGVVLFVALAASFLPARRAAKIEPSSALRAN